MTTQVWHSSSSTTAQRPAINATGEVKREDVAPPGSTVGGISQEKRGVPLLPNAINLAALPIESPAISRSPCRVATGSETASQIPEAMFVCQSSVAEPDCTRIASTRGSA